MDSILFNKIHSSDYPKHSSFALWNKNNITDSSIIINNIESLRNDVILLGWNGTQSGDGKYGNFHCSYKGCKDSYIAEAFDSSNSRFCGAYMTDIIIDNKSTVMNNVPLTKKDLDRLTDELHFIGFFESNNPTILALGQKVYDSITKNTNIYDETYKALLEIKFNISITVFKIPHHATHGLSKSEFINKVNVL